MKTGRPRLEDEQRLRHAVTVRFAVRDFALMPTAAKDLGVKPTAAVRELALAGVGKPRHHEDRIDRLAEIRAIGQTLNRLAIRLDQPTSAAAAANVRKKLAAVRAAAQEAATIMAALAPRSES